MTNPDSKAPNTEGLPSKRVLVTAGLPYSNGRLHVGHIAGAYLPTDIYVRYLRMNGVEVRSICGSDDHGVAIKMEAQKQGKTPAEIAKFYNQKQQEDLAGLGIHFDVYGSTSQSPYHREACQGFFKKIFERGFFEKQTSRQFYDQSKYAFLPDRYVKGTCGYCDTPGQNGDQCENCGKILDVDHLKVAVSEMSGEPASIKETVHWYLDLTQFESSVADWLKTAKLRDGTRNYVQSLLSSGLVKRAMTRDLDWGIPVPIDDPDAEGKVMYVWFDAPIGYISNTMELCQERDGDAARYADWWKSPDTEIVHFIGEDNTIFHCLIWIAMLRAEKSFQLPSAVVVNQFLNIQFPDREVEKISKSRGAAVWIGEYLEEGGNTDLLRYYLTSIAPEKARTVYSADDLKQKNNTDLANTLGNFVNRILSFNRKYCGPQVPELIELKINEVDRAFMKRREQSFLNICYLLNHYSFKAALAEIMDFARDCNKYVDDQAPWVSRKTDMERTQVTLYYAIQAIRYLGIVLRPVMPETSDKILGMLGLDTVDPIWGSALDEIPVGAPLGEPVILFTKID